MTDKQKFIELANILKDEYKERRSRAGGSTLRVWGRLFSFNDFEELFRVQELIERTNASHAYYKTIGKVAKGG